MLLLTLIAVRCVSCAGARVALSSSVPTDTLIRAYTRAYRHADCQAGVPTNRGLSVEEDTTMAESLWPLVNPVTVSGLSSTCRTQGIRRLDFRVKVTLRQM